MKIDFDYAYDHPCYRPKFPDELFERLAKKYRIGLRGQRVLDLGTGAGTLARAFARRGCLATGLDPNQQQLDEAMRIDGLQGVRSSYVAALAERTGQPDASFDVVSAGQTWHWFDGRAAATEARRVLKPGGFLVIAYVDWLSLKGNVADATEELIERHNPAFRFRGWSGFNPLWVNDAVNAGFVDAEHFFFDVSVMYSHEYWRGRVRDSAGLHQSLKPEQVARFDEELARVLQQRFSPDPMPVPHRIFCIIARAP
jgi:SAM-dependent methyltransferase